MDLATFHRLLTPAGLRLLDAATASYGDVDVLVLSDRLRSLAGEEPAELVAAALTQAGLRRAAVAKLGPDAGRMYFTPAGLEQATRAAVAAHRAQRAAALSGGGSLLDLGCGIGSDLLAFARAGFEVLGIERDPVVAAVAEANLTACGLAGRVQTGVAEDADLSAPGTVFVDPARRTAARRIFDPTAYSPTWEFVVGLLDRAGPDGAGSGPGLAVAKLAPGFDHGLIPAGVEADWVSHDGELKELALWAPLPSMAVRRATVLGVGGAPSTVCDRDLPPGPPPVGAVGAFVHEPDPALVRAHLVGAVVAELDGWLLDPHLAYVSTESSATSRFARSYRVLEVLPFKERALRAALRARSIGSVTIKKRGVVVAPELLRRRLALRGDEHATLMLSRTPGSAVALLVEPVRPAAA